MMKTLFSYLVFPGFLFSVCVGLVAGWVDRKVTARVQWREGPPWYQNFMDIAKLFTKETILPEGAGATFLVAPFIGMLSLILAATILGISVISPGRGFSGDLIVVIYLLMVPAIAMIIGAFSSRNILASLGGSREMKLVMGYELPFILSMVAVIIKSGGAIQLGQIITHQSGSGANLWSWPGFIAFIAAVLCMQAKLGFVPFDIGEADQEIMGGALIEYSGPLLAVFKMTKAILVYTMPLFLIILFWGGDLRLLSVAYKYVILLVIIILIKNTNPRLRIDQALRFFWGPVTVLAVLALVLAIGGL